MHSPKQFPRSLSIALFCAGCCLTIPLRAEDNSSQVSQAQEQLKTEHFAEALASATEAVRLNPDDYRGHYYVAMASMVLGKFDEAEAAVARAQTLAPDNAKATIDKLRATIATNRQGEDKVAAANAALADGLLAKAARLYREAWSPKHDKPDLALKAADLYANRLGDPVTAATLLREVISVTQGTQTADKAQVELDKVAGTVKKIALQKFEQAKATQKWDDEIRLLAEALAADPTNQEIYLWRADLGSRGGDPAYFQATIKDLARVGLASEENLLHLTGLPMALEDAKFTEFLSDVIGAENVAHLKTTLVQRRAAAKAAAEQREADRQAAIKRAAAAVEASHRAEVARLDALQADLQVNTEAIVSKIGEMRALRRQQWEDFIALLNGVIIEKEFRVKDKYRTFGFNHFQNHLSIAPNAVTISSLWEENSSNWREVVVVMPGRLDVEEFVEQTPGAWQVGISDNPRTAIEEIGEMNVPHTSVARIWWNGNKYDLSAPATRIAAIQALQPKMWELHQEISALFVTVKEERRKLEAAGRKVSHDPVYPPVGPPGGQ